MAPYIPRSIFHLARLLYIRPETFGPTLVLLALGVRFEHLLYCTFEVCKRKCYKTARWTVL
jgi:hypothetical protein